MFKVIFNLIHFHFLHVHKISLPSFFQTIAGLSWKMPYDELFFVCLEAFEELFIEKLILNIYRALFWFGLNHSVELTGLFLILQSVNRLNQEKNSKQTFSHPHSAKRFSIFFKSFSLDNYDFSFGSRFVFLIHDFGESRAELLITFRKKFWKLKN